MPGGGELLAVWEILWKGGTIGLLFLLLMAILTGKLIPRLHHDWALDQLKEDRDQWREQARDLKLAIDRLAILLEARRAR